jgi:hypothetical protein
MRSWIAAGLIGACAMAIASQSLAGSRLSQYQLNKLFPGTYVGTYGRKKAFVIKARANGGVSGIVDGKHDSGLWAIKAGKLCIAWKHWTHGTPKCRFVTRRGAWYFALNSRGKSKIKFRRR